MKDLSMKVLLQEGLRKKLELANVQRPKNFDVLSPSTVSSCLRGAYYATFLGKTTEAQLLLASERGKLIHTFVQDLLQLSGTPVEIEQWAEKQMEGFLIRGRFDILIGDTIIDIKTTSHLKETTEAKPEHIRQVQTYLVTRNLTKGIVAYMNTDVEHLDVKEFPVTLTKEEETALLDRYRLYHTCIKTKTLPPAERALSCHYCPFRMSMCLNDINVE